MVLHFMSEILYELLSLYDEYSIGESENNISALSHSLISLLNTIILNLSFILQHNNTFFFQILLLFPFFYCCFVLNFSFFFVKEPRANR
jgi:hypothetical protein